MFVIYLRTKFHSPDPPGSLVVAVKPKSKCGRMIASLVSSHQKLHIYIFFFSKSFTVQDLTTLGASVISDLRFCLLGCCAM